MWQQVDGPRNWQANPNIHLGQETQNSWSNLEKEQSYSRYTSAFQKLLQSYSNQNNVVLV